MGTQKSSEFTSATARVSSLRMLLITATSGSSSRKSLQGKPADILLVGKLDILTFQPLNSWGGWDTLKKTLKFQTLSNVKFAM